MKEQSIVARESQHTQLPWRVDKEIDRGGWISISGGGYIVADVNDSHPNAKVSRADAQFIVRACNAHTSLVEALQAIRIDAKRLRAINLPGFLGSSADTYAGEILEQAEQALRLAQGEK